MGGESKVSVLSVFSLGLDLFPKSSGISGWLAGKGHPKDASIGNIRKIDGNFLPLFPILMKGQRVEGGKG